MLATLLVIFLAGVCFYILRPDLFKKIAREIGVFFYVFIAWAAGPAIIIGIIAFGQSTCDRQNNRPRVEQRME